MEIVTVTPVGQVRDRKLIMLLGWVPGPQPAMDIFVQMVCVPQIITLSRWSCFKGRRGLGKAPGHREEKEIMVWEWATRKYWMLSLCSHIGDQLHSSNALETFREQNLPSPSKEGACIFYSSDNTPEAQGDWETFLWWLRTRQGREQTQWCTRPWCLFSMTGDPSLTIRPSAGLHHPSESCLDPELQLTHGTDSLISLICLGLRERTRSPTSPVWFSPPLKRWKI